MKSLNTIMSEYFNTAQSNSSILSSHKLLNLREAPDLPVSPSRSEWEILEDPTRLGRSFEFKSREQLRFFLDEILEHEDNTGHNGKIIIDGNEIVIEVYTHDVNNVTELDTEYAAIADEIYLDAQKAYE